MALPVQDPDALCATAEAEQVELRTRLTAATELLPKVALERPLKVMIAEICSLLDVDGIRGDITTNKANPKNPKPCSTDQAAILVAT